MRLWRISQSENTGYDTFDAAVVAAWSEEDARGIHPYSSIFPDDDHWGSRGIWASKPENVKVELLGNAKEGVARGVIVASFNAG